MRQLLAAVTLGVLWVCAAPAQQPMEGAKDANPPLLLSETRPVGQVSLGDDAYYESPTLQERRAAWLRSVTPALFRGLEQDMDASWYGEVARAKSRLSLGNLFTPQQDVPTPRRVIAYLGMGVIYDDATYASPYVDVLNALGFLEALSTLKLGPDMDPHFNDPARSKWEFLDRY